MIALAWTAVVLVVVAFHAVISALWIGAIRRAGHGLGMAIPPVAMMNAGLMVPGAAGDSMLVAGTLAAIWLALTKGPPGRRGKRREGDAMSDIQEAVWRREASAAA